MGNLALELFQLHVLFVELPSKAAFGRGWDTRVGSTKGAGAHPCLNAILSPGRMAEFSSGELAPVSRQGHRPYLFTELPVGLLAVGDFGKKLLSLQDRVGFPAWRQLESVSTASLATGYRAIRTDGRGCNRLLALTAERNAAGTSALFSSLSMFLSVPFASSNSCSCSKSSDLVRLSRSKKDAVKKERQHSACAGT